MLIVNFMELELLKRKRLKKQKLFVNLTEE